MALIIGMDEAGYGPNLGPLVIGATAWEVPDDPANVDLWKAFSPIVEQSAPVNGSHVQIADSKQVYKPGKGLQNLEFGVLNSILLFNAFRSLGSPVSSAPANEPRHPATFCELIQRVAMAEFDSPNTEPWFAEGRLEITDIRVRAKTTAWLARCREHRVSPCAMRCDVVLTRRFNELTRRHDSKGRALSELSMDLLRHVWQECNADQFDRVLILADKHGGRNRYHEFLPIVFGDRFIRSLNESGESSRYRVGNAEIRFETKSERHLPVALASMLCKYVRELSMELFNQFWCSRLPGLKSTAGYPVDALRFKQDIADLQSRLGICNDDLWRER
jgi:hypothetical protein